MTSALMAMGSNFQELAQLPEGEVGEQQIFVNMFSQVGKNDLGAFKTYLEGNFGDISHAVSALKYSYSIRPRIFANNPDDILQVNPANLFEKVTGNSAISAYMDTNVFFEMINNIELLESQYEVVRGHWPENYNEMVFVLTDPNSITDYMAYALGIKDATGLQEMIQQIMKGEAVVDNSQAGRWTYEDLMNLTFRLVNPTDLYRYNAEYAVWEDMSGDAEHMHDLISSSEELKVVGIVCPREGATATLLSSGIAYTEALTYHVMEQAAQSPMVIEQLANPEIDVFTGKEFGAAQDEEDQLSFENMITVDGDAISSAFGVNVDSNAIVNMLSSYLSQVLKEMNIDTTAAQQDFLDTFRVMANEMLLDHIAANAEEDGKARLYLEDGPILAEAYLAGPGMAHMEELAEKYPVTVSEFSQVYQPLLEGLVNDCVASGLTPSEAAPEDETEAPEAETEAPTDETEAPTEPSEEETEGTEPDATEPEVTVPPVDMPDIEEFIFVRISAPMVPGLVDGYMVNTVVTGTAAAMGSRMMSNEISAILMDKVSGFGNLLAGYMGSAFYVNEEKLASAFQFNLTEEEITRLMMAMSGQGSERSAGANLRTLGYADLEVPTSMSVYMVDFAAKEEFIAFLDAYNEKMEAEDEEKVISYTDITGIMMSSVRTIIDSVSYALIAFVAVSLVVSSIMIGIITYISVMERTKEIGVLRAIGASKRNISQVFNAETFIIGLCAGLLGVGVTWLLIFPINSVIHSVTGNMDINAVLPVKAAVILVVLSMLLTIIGGLIPSKKAAQKDPVIALRSEKQ